MQQLITDGQLVQIGRLLKPHGVNGEITVLLTADVDLAALKCVFLKIDGIFVPFFLSAVRPKSSETDLITIDGIGSEKEAAELCPLELYAMRSELPEDDCEEGMYAADLVGFRIRTEEAPIGTIVGIDDTTSNCLFVIESDAGGQLLVPAVNEFIVSLDVERRELVVDLPEGLLDV